MQKETFSLQWPTLFRASKKLRDHFKYLLSVEAKTKNTGYFSIGNEPYLFFKQLHNFLIHTFILRRVYLDNNQPIFFPQENS